MLFARNGHAACWFGKSEILVTGSKIESCANTCEIYETEMDKWTMLSEMHIPRHFHSITAI